MKYVLPALFAGLLALAQAGPAMADLTVREAIVVGQVDDGPWTTAPTEARVDQTARLAVVLSATERRRGRERTVYIADDHITSLIIEGRRIRSSARRPWTTLSGAEVRWSTVEPYAWHDPIARIYHSNVSVDPKTWGRWIGYTPITYFSTAVSAFDPAPEARLRPASIIPSDPEVAHRPDDIADLGTIRYRVEVRHGDTVWASPGPEATSRTGISKAVHRVSIRRDDTYIGHLTGFFLVPEIFGSAGRGTGHQTERYIGGDCADILTGGIRAAGQRHIAYGNVANMHRDARRISKLTRLDATGTPPEPIEGIEVGDIIRINYGGELAGHTPRSWDHVAVVYADRSPGENGAHGPPNGRLDGVDLVIHMGHPRLTIEPLTSQSPAIVDVLRWKKRRGS